MAPTFRSGRVCSWQECGLSYREGVFTFNLVYKGISLKDNAAINRFSVKHKEV
jgi:hypothetical protein